MSGERENGCENAFFDSADGTEKCSSNLQAKSTLQTAGGSASPKILASVSSSRPPVLPVKKSRSFEVALSRYSSFCNSGCVSAAKRT